MNKNLNLAQVFIIARAFLGKEYFKKYSDDLGIIHGDFIINTHKDRWQQEPETWDPAVWIDWMLAANQVLSPEIADPATTQVTALQGYQIMEKFIHNFAYEYEFQDLIELYKKIAIDKYPDFAKINYWKSWILCVDAMLENKLTFDKSLLSLDSILSQQQAFEIMQLFLRTYFLKLSAEVQPKWFVDLQNLTFSQAQQSLLCREWFEIYQCKRLSETDTVTLLDAFNVMRIFLEKFQTTTNDVHLVAFFETLKVRPDTIPLDYQSTYNWIQAAYRVIIPD